jgi:glycosyltransferase
MKISLITATWDSENSIPETLRSIADQSLERDQLEWIVVDGASTDGTLDLIQNSPVKPDQLISEPDQGIYDALNKGVRMASGEVVGFLHADDFFAGPDVLKHIVEAFEKHAADAVYGDLQYVRKSAESFSVLRHWESGDYNPGKLRWGWMPPHPSLYLKRAIYERAIMPTGDYFDTSFSCAADYDLMLRVLSKYAVNPIYLPEVFVKMQVGGVSNRSLKHIVRKSKEDWQVIRRNRIGHIHTLVWKNLGKLGQFVPGRNKTR